ncbi:MAG: hypothetical protein B6D64_08430 [Bacteroidetes bacterium 4484_276]|nr:MAG: hypothetical protein B6D64_08430 [Bacteroidetes bacterium 4484_276]
MINPAWAGQTVDQERGKWKMESGKGKVEILNYEKYYICIMKNIVIAFFLTLVIIFGPFTANGQTNDNTPVPFTLADRDRIMRTEQRLGAFEKSTDERFASMQKSMDERFTSLQKSMDERFVSVQKSMDERFDSMQKSMDERFSSQQKQLDSIYTLLFFILGGVMSLMGFVIYDRRTAIKPIQREHETLVRALREYSEKHVDLAEVFKKAGIL